MTEPPEEPTNNTDHTEAVSARATKGEKKRKEKRKKKKEGKRKGERRVSKRKGKERGKSEVSLINYWGMRPSVRSR